VTRPSYAGVVLLGAYPEAATNKARQTKRGRIAMAISNAMLAQALLEYFQQNAESFGAFLTGRFQIDDGYVTWSEDARNKRLLVTVTIKAQDGETLSQRVYAIKIESISQP
jgi:hypothetical protein